MAKIVRVSGLLPGTEQADVIIVKKNSKLGRKLKELGYRKVKGFTKPKGKIAVALKPPDLGRSGS